MRSLENLRIASPCPARWAEMNGDDRVRHCDLCKLNVYNVAGMTRQEAEAVIQGVEGRLCLRLARRADGTIITRDCPVGAAGVRRRLVFALAMGISCLWAGLAAAAKVASPARGDTKLESLYADAKEKVLAVEPFKSLCPQPQVTVGISITPSTPLGPSYGLKHAPYLPDTDIGTH